jgi:hypothetical protein
LSVDSFPKLWYYNHRKKERDVKLQELKNLFMENLSQVQNDFDELNYQDMVNDFANIHSNSFEEYMEIWEMLV